MKASEGRNIKHARGTFFISSPLASGFSARAVYVSRSRGEKAVTNVVYNKCGVIFSAKTYELAISAQWLMSWRESGRNVKIAAKSTRCA